MMNQLDVFESHDNTQQNNPSRITQWVCGNGDYRSLLLPTLAWQSHHNNQRWITWIASRFIEKQTLLDYQVNLSNLRMIVDSSSDYSSFKLLVTALKNQRSSTVIASLPKLNTQQLQQLEQAAREGNSKGLIITER